MNTQRLLAAGAAALGMSMTALARLAAGSSIHESLWVTLGLFAVSLAAALLYQPAQPLSAWERWFVGVPAALAAVAAVVELPTVWAAWQGGAKDAGPVSQYLASRSQVWVGCYLGVVLAGIFVLPSQAIRSQGQCQTTQPTTRRRLARALLAVCLVLVAWGAWRVLRYGPADQNTYAKIRPGMTMGEVDALFGRPPFLDSDQTPLRPDIRETLIGDRPNRGWDGPEGLILVTFDAAGRVEAARFTPARDAPTTFDRFRARLGLWP
jgi:hypothetical protein